MKKSLVLIASIALAVASVGCSSSKKNEQKEQAAAQTPAKPETSAQELFIQGNEKLDAREYEKAASLYRRALERDPERTDIYINLAITLSKGREFEEAVNTMQDALAHGGKSDPAVYFTLGNIYQENAHYTQAIRAYRTSLARGDSRDSDTIANLASAYLLLKEIDKARATYEHLREIAPDDPRSYTGLGLIHHLQHHHDKALEFYDQALRVDSSFPQTWYNRADLLSDMERTSEAISAFERYLELAPDGPYRSTAQTRLERLKKGVD